MTETGPERAARVSLVVVGLVVLLLTVVAAGVWVFSAVKFAGCSVGDAGQACADARGDFTPTGFAIAGCLVTGVGLMMAARAEHPSWRLIAGAAVVAALVALAVVGSAYLHAVSAL